MRLSAKPGDSKVSLVSLYVASVDISVQQICSLLNSDMVGLVEASCAVVYSTADWASRGAAPLHTLKHSSRGLCCMKKGTSGLHCVSSAT